jgi:hypothetical protein
MILLDWHDGDGKATARHAIVELIMGANGLEFVITDQMTDDSLHFTLDQAVSNLIEGLETGDDLDLTYDEGRKLCRTALLMQIAAEKLRITHGHAIISPEPQPLAGETQQSAGLRVVVDNVEPPVAS